MTASRCGAVGPRRRLEPAQGSAGATPAFLRASCHSGPRARLRADPSPLHARQGPPQFRWWECGPERNSLPGNLGPRGRRAGGLRTQGPREASWKFCQLCFGRFPGRGYSALSREAGRTKLPPRSRSRERPARWEGEEARESATLALGPGPWARPSPPARAGGAEGTG